MAEPSNLSQKSQEVYSEVNAKVELSNAVRQRLENLNVFSEDFFSQVLVYDSTRAGFRWVTKLNVAGNIFESNRTKRIDAEIDASSSALTYIDDHASEFEDNLLRMHHEVCCPPTTRRRCSCSCGCSAQQIVPRLSRGSVHPKAEVKANRSFVSILHFFALIAKTARCTRIEED